MQNEIMKQFFSIVNCSLC